MNQANTVPITPGAEAENVRQPQAIGPKIDALYELRERKRALEAELKDVNGRIDELDAELQDEMAFQGVTMSRGTRASVSLTESTVPQIEDWDEVMKYAKEYDAFYLFERRVSATPWRELHESGQTVPGTKPFVRKKLSVRKV